jgi:Peptidase family M1 domain
MRALASGFLLLLNLYYASAQTILPSGFPTDMEDRLKQERLAGLVHTMNVSMNDDDFTFKGTSRVEFTNNTPDTLRQIFFHAHFNAFQPNSLTAKRVAAIGPNRLKPETFANLKPNEIGKLEILPGTANGAAFTTQRVGTIVRLDLAKPLLPQERIALEFAFEGQVPVQIRRSGRNNAQGVRYSMAQWFPKLCQYDAHGWQNNQFVLREFYGVWGKYDVKITLPAKYVVGASGDLQNPQECGFGYVSKGDTTVLPKVDAEKPQGVKMWHFVAFPVHDFAWVADADYIHRVVKMPASSPISPGMTFHILSKPKFDAVWKNATDWLPRVFRFVGEKYLPYPYQQFTCAQAGDGGMEYPNLVMIRSSDFVETLGTIAHEATHQWFYGMAANNETKHAWMDEGITDYLTDRIMAEEFATDEQVKTTWLENALIPRRKDALESNRAFLRVHALGYDEPLSIPHDRFNEDATAVMVYRKGSAWLRQFEYSFGKDKVDELLRKYQTVWRFRHPYPPDFEKLASEVFGQRMDEVFDTALRGTELPDYTLQSLRSEPIINGNFRNTVQLTKRERAHVPLRLFATDIRGETRALSIPSDMLNAPNGDTTRLAPWFWAAPDYTAEFLTPHEIMHVHLDTAGMLLREDLLKNAISSRGLFNTLPDIRVGFMTRFDEAMPLDYYGISLRPSVWYDPLGGLQLGIRTDGVGTYQTPKITLGAYYNLGNRRFDWQVGTSWATSVLTEGSFTTDIRLFSMDGMGGVTLRSNRDAPAVRFAVNNEFRIRAFMLDYFRLTDESYLFPGSRLPDYSQQSPWRYEEPKLDILRLGITGEQRWRTGIIQTELNVATIRGLWLQGRFEWSDVLFDAPYLGIRSRIFAYGMLGFSGYYEDSSVLYYSLQSGSILERFENIPARFARFAANSVRLPVGLSVFSPGGGGFVRSQLDGKLAIAVLNVFVGDRTIRQSTGLRLPILDAFKPGLWLSAGFASPNSRIYNFPDNRGFFNFDSGISLSINLADTRSSSTLLFMFKDEVSLTAYVPLVSYIPGRNWILGYDGVRFGVSTTIAR